MSNGVNKSGYSFLKDTWRQQKKYTLQPLINKKIKENFGSFSLRAAVRPPYSTRWGNQYEKSDTYFGVS